ncbi:ABC transporter permease [Halobacteriales archaeon QS_8_69_26]|nr:MAG: ABC transporter permease [Halobacteriales archaeon QS_8_69_26]
MVETRLSFKYVAKRAAVSIFIIWALLTLLFLLLKAMPGDIADILLNPQLDQESIEALRRRYGLNQPLWKQYLRWVFNYATFDFGYSLNSTDKVVTIIAIRLPRTLVLFGTAFLLQYTVGIIAGIHFGWNRGTKTDKGGFLTGLTLYSVPFFWIGWMLLLVFAHGQFAFDVLPLGHMTTAFQSEFSALNLVTDVMYHLVLPAGSLLIVGWAGAMLVMRTSMQEVVDAPYIETARAKGLPPSVVKYKHGARNALIPVATQAIIGIAFIIDGSVIVETVFSWPGIGALLVSAILERNFPVALAAFFFLGVLVVVMRFLTDVAYTFLDPRIKFGESS